MSAAYYAYILLALLVAGHLLYHRRPTQSLIIWLLVVLLLPWAGALLYLLFGSRKVFARQAKAPLRLKAAPSPIDTPLTRLLAADGVPPARPGNRLEMTFSPRTAHDWLFDAIEGARESIWLESYIFTADTTGHRLLETLTEKARAGVQVRLLFDAFGSWQAYRRPELFRNLRAAGGQVAFFQPLSSLWRQRINLRNHRKLYLFDQRLLLTGGINLASEYLDPDRPDSWVDLTCRITGPVVADHAEVFRQDWGWTTDEPLPAPPTLIACADGHPVQAVPSGPDMPADPIREALLHALANARHEVFIVTPYFIPDEPVLEAVLLARKAGVRVRLLTPLKTDHLIFDLGRAPYMRELVEAGAEVRCYTPTMLHAKVVLVDEALVQIGSANLDYRSLLINYELVDFVHDPAFARRLRAELERLWTKTVPYVPPPDKLSRLRENLSRIITPAL